MSGLIDLSAALEPRTYTADLPGTGGVIKSLVSDFKVTEIPAYEHDGSGEHLYVHVEKSGLSHGQLLQRFKRTLGISEREIGWAGIKDRWAVTSQFLSLPCSVEPNLDNLEGEGVRLLSVTRHRNKLKRGHLWGNRFEIVIREAHKDSVERIDAVMDAIPKMGIPNFFGQQRFSKGGANIDRGLRHLDRLKEGGRLRRGFSTTLELQSVQSWLFNQYVILRLERGLFDRVISGDVLKKTDTGGMFDSEDLDDELLRVQSGQLVPTGPIFGSKMWSAAEGSDSVALEAEVLENANLNQATFDAAKKHLRGTRRPIAVIPQDLTRKRSDDGVVELGFSLRKGSYATVFLSEIMKDLAIAKRADLSSNLER